MAKGFNGFVLDTASNKAIFRELTREQFLSKKKKKVGTKLFVVPDPEILSMGRMRKCVKGEGMPVYKNPMLRGNLFIDLEIEFPKTISEDAAKVLAFWSRAFELRHLKAGSFWSNFFGSATATLIQFSVHFCFGNGRLRLDTFRPIPIIH